MKIFLVTVALVMAGLAFIAPPLVIVLPGLLVGLLLIASPLMANSLARDTEQGTRTPDDESSARSERRPTSA
jgi:hypothetical protein